MSLLKRLPLLATSIALFLSLLTTYTYAAPSEDEEPANKCREVALEMDWLSRYQDRPACTQNLDGASVFLLGITSIDTIN